MAPMRLTALLLSLCLLAPALPSRASTNKQSACAPATTYAYFNLSVLAGELAGTCQWAVGTGPVLLTVNVELLSAEVSKVRFSIPDPPFGTLVGEGWNFPSTGDRTTGIELDLGCTSGGNVTLGTFFVFLDSGETVSCATWKVNAGAEADDCDGNMQPAEAAVFTFNSIPDYNYCDTCWQRCQTLPPYGLQPEQGATGVPLDAPLSWTYPIIPGPPDPLSVQCWIDIGTDLGCGDAQHILVPCDLGSIVLDFLEHSTTYYWQAGWAETGAGCTIYNLTPVHWFTTAGPIATEKTTWGHMKAMYRD